MGDQDSMKSNLCVHVLMTINKTINKRTFFPSDTDIVLFDKNVINHN